MSAGGDYTLNDHESIRDFLLDQVASHPQLKGKVNVVGEAYEDRDASYFEVESGGRFFVITVKQAGDDD